MTTTGTPTPAPTLSTGRRIAGVGLATGSGVLVALQSRINGELGVRLADGIAAAVVSFGLGLLILLVLVPATPGADEGWPRCAARCAPARCGRGSAWAACAARSWWRRRG